MEDFRRKIILIILTAATVIFLAQALPPLVKSSQPFLGGLFGLTGGASPEEVQEVQKKEAITRRFGAEEISPLFGVMRISAVNFLSNPISMKIMLSGGKSAVNVTGWKIKTNSGEFIVSQAFETYDSSGGKERDVVLGGGQSAVFYGSGNEFGNFKLNKCSGFLQDVYNFNPPLEPACPAVNRAEIINLSGKCQNYILSLPSCSLPKADFINELSNSYADSSCKDFLSRINYDTCLKKHGREKDFSLGEWRIWIGQNIFDSQHDWIRLFDSQGLLVDEFIY